MIYTSQPQEQAGTLDCGLNHFPRRPRPHDIPNGGEILTGKGVSHNLNRVRRSKVRIHSIALRDTQRGTLDIAEIWTLFGNSFLAYTRTNPLSESEPDET